MKEDTKHELLSGLSHGLVITSFGAIPIHLDQKSFERRILHLYDLYGSYLGRPGKAITVYSPELEGWGPRLPSKKDFLKRVNKITRPIRYTKYGLIGLGVTGLLFSLLGHKYWNKKYLNKKEYDKAMARAALYSVPIIAASDIPLHYVAKKYPATKYLERLGFKPLKPPKFLGPMLGGLIALSALRQLHKKSALKKSLSKSERELTKAKAQMAVGGIGTGLGLLGAYRLHRRIKSLPLISELEKGLKNEFPSLELLSRAIITPKELVPLLANYHKTLDILYDAKMLKKLSLASAVASGGLAAHGFYKFLKHRKIGRK